MKEVVSEENMLFLLPTGVKDSLFLSKGTEIEVSCKKGTGIVWYCALLEKTPVKSKKYKIFVRHLKPLVKEDFSPPLIETTFHRLIRPAVPSHYPFLEVCFEEGDVVDVAHNGGWYSGWVIQVLAKQRFLVYLESDPDVIDIDRKDLRPHLVWKDEEWFRCQKRQLIKSDFSAGKPVEIQAEVEPLGDIWTPGLAIKDNEDGTLMVKCKSLSSEEDKYDKISFHYSKIRPSPPPFGLRVFKLKENVEAFVEAGWCPGVVTKVLWEKRYTISFGRDKENKDFDHLKLRPAMKWKDGVWQTEEKVSGSEESPYATHKSVTRSSSGAIQKSPSSSSKGGDIAKVGKVSITESTQAHEEATKRDRVNKRKRGRPCRFICTELKQRTGTDDDLMLNFAVGTPPTKDSLMVLPFVKKSPCWEVLEAMENFKAVPQHPHFSPLLEFDEEIREGEAVGAMVMFNGLLDKLKNIQVDDPLSVIKRINESFLKLEKLGFNVTLPRSRICKILSIKKSETCSLEKMEVVKREITEKDSKRKKCEDDIDDFTKKILELEGQRDLLKEEKVTLDNEIAQMQFHEYVLNQKIKNREQDFRAIVSAPWN